METGARPSVVVSSDEGLFAVLGLLPKEERAAVQALDPCVEAMFIMMAADGIVGEDERDVLRGAVRELTDHSIRATTLDIMLSRYAKALEAEGRDACIRRVAQRLGDDVASAENAFVLAAVVAFADSAIADQENEVLNELAEKLGIGEERANQLLDELENDWGS